MLEYKNDKVYKYCRDNSGEKSMKCGHNYQCPAALAWSRCSDREDVGKRWEQEKQITPTFSHAFHLRFIPTL